MNMDKKKKLISIRIHPDILEDGQQLAKLKHKTLTQIIEDGIELQADTYKDLLIIK